MNDTTISVGMSEVERIRHQLYRSIHTPGLNPQNVFILLIRLLREQFPEEKDDARRNSYEFRRIIESPYPDGLELPASEILRMVEDFKHPHEVGTHRSQEVVKEMAWMRRRVRLLLPGIAYQHGEIGYGHGRGVESRVDNINSAPSKGGTDPTYIMRRLNRDYPELAERVAKGELSANAAAIEAGFRKPPSALKALQTAWSRATEDERTQFLESIKS